MERKELVLENVAPGEVAAELPAPRGNDGP